MEAEEQQVENKALSEEVGNERVQHGKWGGFVVPWAEPQEVSIKNSAGEIDCPLGQLTPSHSFQSIK